MTQETNSAFRTLDLLIVGRCDIDIKNLFKYMGFRNIRNIRNGEDSIKEASENVYHFIIVFRNLIDMPGEDFVKQLRTNNKCKSRFSHVILVTNSSEITKNTAAFARDSGITEIITYPFESRAMINKIRAIIENPRNFIISRGYIGPDRRRKKIEVAEEKRKKTD